MDLTPFIARGFPGDFDRVVAEVPVAEPDRSQTLGMIRVCPETEAIVYSRSFSPTRVRYRKGSRPELERIARSLQSDDLVQSVDNTMHWVADRVQHAWLHERTLAPDRGMTEEQLIDSGIAWCNEQARVFIALCEVMNIPGRLCFLFHGKRLCGHTAVEVYIDERWLFVDPTFRVLGTLADGKLAEGRDLSGPRRMEADRMYREAYDSFEPAMASRHRESWARNYGVDPDHPAELLAHLGISNYITPGVECTSGPYHRCERT